MIRINLLGQARPKAAKKAVPLEATVQIVFLLVAIGVAAVVLGITFYQQKSELDKTNAKIAALRNEKTALMQVKQEVDRFESQKAILQQRIDVIEALQRNRTGAQELMDQVANTVVRVDQLWLTGLTQTGSSLDIEGEAGSINAVANFLTQLKRSGYFDQIEIKEAKENDIEKGVETFGFSISAGINATAPLAGQAQAQPTGTSKTIQQSPSKGRS